MPAVEPYSLIVARSFWRAACTLALFSFTITSIAFFTSSLDFWFESNLVFSVLLQLVNLLFKLFQLVYGGLIFC